MKRSSYCLPSSGLRTVLSVEVDEVCWRPDIPVPPLRFAQPSRMRWGRQGRRPYQGWSVAVDVPQRVTTEIVVAVDHVTALFGATWRAITVTTG
jgi:hypothetical protein